MKRYSHVCINYIDDFLIIGDDYLACKSALDCLLSLIPSLGLKINWDKVEGPLTSLSFLGVQIDCVSRTLSLPPKKLLTVKSMIASWMTKQRATKREIQQIVGKLNWCSRVVQGGRTFMRNLIDLIAKLKKPHHHIKLSYGAKQDLLWWRTGLELFHGKIGFCCDVPLPNFEFSTDACLVGGGAHFRDDWFYVNWVLDMPEVANSHINVLELETIHLAAEFWGSKWQGLHILVRSDNSATVSAINKGTSKSPELLKIVQKLFWLAVKFQFKLTALFIPGRLNILSDLISRLHSMDHAMDAQCFLGSVGSSIECNSHMTEASFLYLQAMWLGT